MPISPLATEKIWTEKYQDRRGAKPTRCIDHYTAGGTNDSNKIELGGPEGGRNVSANYLILTDGKIVSIVDEAYRAWASGSFAADQPSISIEVVISVGGQPTAAQVEALAKLHADCSRRWGWGALNRNNIRGHREFYPTICPGPLWDRRDEIIAKSNAYLNGAAASAPAPAKPAFDLNRVATEILNGAWGSDPQRREQLTAAFGADNAAAAQAEVNRRVSGGAPTVTTILNVDAIAREVMVGKWGNDPQRTQRLTARFGADGAAKVQARVNQLCQGAQQKPAPVNIDALATEVIAGKWGNNPERHNRLAAKYGANVANQVQARVNQRLS